MKHKILILLCLIWLTACTPPQTEPASIETTRPTVTAVPTTIPVATETPLPTPTAVPFITPTPVPPTLIPTPTAIPPPQPALFTGRSNEAVISDDGRFITFLSAGKLTNDAVGGNLDVFLRDMESDTTELINLNLAGEPTFHDAYNVRMSGNGRLIAYFSFDGNIVPDDTVMCGDVSCEDLFIYDGDTGTTTMVALGRGQGLGADYTMGASADGRYIALGHQNNLLLYNHETKQAQPVLSTIDGTEPNGYSYAPSLSADGRYIAFVSRASNLVANDTNEQSDVFVLDRDTGQIERVSVASDGTEADGISGAMPAHEMVNGKADISADGRFVTFPAAATNLGNDASVECEDYRGFTRPCYQVYLHDRESGITLVVSKGGNNDSLDPAISADGRYLAFTSLATSLTSDELPACEFPAITTCGHIYLFDAQVGEMVLVTSQANAASWGVDMSADGRYLTFTSEATNLVPDDGNDHSDIFRYDRQTNQFELVSTTN